MEPTDVMEHDIKKFLTQFENTKDKADRIKIVLDGKARLFKEAKEIKEVISGHLADLMEAKKLAIRLNNLVHKYEKKALDDQKDVDLKLADQITIKEILKDKIHREVQGMRISPTEYSELSQANQQDLDKITKDVYDKLGQY